MKDYFIIPYSLGEYHVHGEYGNVSYFLARVTGDTYSIRLHFLPAKKGFPPPPPQACFYDLYIHVKEVLLIDPVQNCHAQISQQVRKMYYHDDKGLSEFK